MNVSIVSSLEQIRTGVSSTRLEHQFELGATHIQNSFDRCRDPFAGRIQVLRQWLEVNTPQADR
jgi:hypothetical protein